MRNVGGEPARRTIETVSPFPNILYPIPLSTTLDSAALLPRPVFPTLLLEERS